MPNDPKSVGTDLVGFGKAAEQLIKTGEKFLEKLIGPSLEEQGQLWADKVRRRRDNMNRIAGMAKEMVGGQAIQAIPGRILWPVLERASVEEDDTDLQRRWAALLANASTHPEAVHPAFPHILGELSPHDVLILDWLFEQSPYKSDPPSGGYDTVTLDRLMDIQKLSSETAINILASLGRHNLIFMPNIVLDVHDFYEHRFQHTRVTSYGVAFVRACRPPQREGPPVAEVVPD